MPVVRGTRLAEFDFSGIEAVLSGYFMRDPAYIRLAKLGVHAGLASHVLRRPYNPAWPDAQIAAYFKALKHADPIVYDRCKRTVHGCLTTEHDVLTSTGWVPIGEYAGDTPVAQWENGTLSFVVPSAVTRVPFQGTHLISLFGRSLSAVMTPDHRIPFKYGAATAWTEKTAATLPTQGNIPVGGCLAGTEQVDHDLLRLIVAVQADAAVGCGQVVFHLVKERKIQRLHGILERLGSEYTDVPCACHPTGRRIRLRTTLSDLVLAWLEGKDKLFHLPLFLSLTQVCREVVLAELPYWDGSTNANHHYRYFTTCREQASRVQTLAATVGRQALLREQATGRTGYSSRPLYTVSFNSRYYAAVESLERTEVPYQGTVYCLTVPSGYFLIRHRDRISVTGNTNYGLTEFGMVRNFPEYFPTLTVARKLKAVYAEMAPALPKWHQHLRELAYQQNFLGGPGAHPYGYKHWFWSVLAFRGIPYNVYLRRQKLHEPVTTIQGKYYAIVLGEDAKRVVAFYPQSTAAGVLKEVMIRLFDPESPSYIGDAYYGRTPFRAPIHDSILLEIPNRVWDRVVELVFQEMLRPIPELPLDWVEAGVRRSLGLGSHLSIGVEAKCGLDWKNMEALAGPEVGVSGEGTFFPHEEEDEEEADALGVVA